MITLLSTPIGTLDDLSIRQVHSLLIADIILAENTSAFGRLLEHARSMVPAISRNPDQQVWRFAREDEYQKTPELLERLQTNPDTQVVLISEAGTPLIADPGMQLVAKARAASVPMTVIPGPSAVHTALLLAGVPFSSYLFVGFLPKKPSELRIRLDKISAWIAQEEELVVVCFVSPHRIIKTLEQIKSDQPNLMVTICREMTKLHEEVLSGTADELLAQLSDRTIKGEITLVVSGS